MLKSTDQSPTGRDGGISGMLGTDQRKADKFGLPEREMCSYLRLIDSDDEFADGCFPTSKQLTRQGESDKDSDTPYLVGPEEIKSLMDEREVGAETP